MATLEHAISVAVKAHSGQPEKGSLPGTPYVTHPLRLMNAVDGVDAKIVAVLHDVVEDTAVTLGDLRSAGFSETVLASLTLVTHDKSESYADYVARIKSDPIARLVKLADLLDNSRMDRCLLRPDRAGDDFARLRRYLLSYKFLTDQIDEPTYRTLMQQFAGG